MQLLRMITTDSDRRPVGGRRRFAGGGAWWPLTVIAISGVAFAGRATAATAAPGHPNILVILADDLGYGDVQCYNPQRGRIPTPNIDRLAAQGMRFTDAHSSSGVCSPSRYTLLTGRYHWRTRLQSGIVKVFGEPTISPDRLTIAGLAKQHGYRTACIGKWHLGWNWPIAESQRKLLQAAPQSGPNDEAPLASAEQRAAWRDIFSQAIGGGPTSCGFDTYFGTDVPNWPPYCLIENDRTAGVPTEFLPRAKLQNNLASTQGPALSGWRLEGILPALAERAAGFLADAAAQPAPFLLYLPLTAPHTPLAVNAPWHKRSGLNTYADFLMETDAMVGRVLDALERSGAADRTLVIFTSDNGFAPYVGAGELEQMGHFPSGPLRGYKGDAWEGGHRVPFIVRWPGVVKPGAECSRLIHQADLMRTMADILGATLPDSAGEDSFSLLPLLQGGSWPVREHAISCAMRGQPALRHGHWKLVAEATGTGGPPVWMAGVPDRGGPITPSTPVLLYYLADDIGETKNLAAAEPARVAAMQALLEQLIVAGRSTPGAPQKNDIEVIRYPRAATAPPGKKSGADRKAGASEG